MGMAHERGACVWRRLGVSYRSGSECLSEICDPAA